MLTENSPLDKPYLRDIFYSILFGIFSVVLSQVQFHIPGVGDSNLREIPLLIALFHIRNPLFIVVLNLSTLIGAPAEIPHWAVYAVHLIPLIVASISFKILERQQLLNTIFGIAWMVITVVYYVVFLVPLVVMALQMVPGNGVSFWQSYSSLLPSVRFEIITSSLVAGLYLMHLEIKRTLEHNNKNLEQIVETRTIELITANNELLSLNEELKASNDGVKELNENLERMVKERTDKINDQLNQLTKYAHMNSHELRAPLARMLGLLMLIKREENPELKKELLDLLFASSTELDTVIKEMNRLLEKEITFNNN